MVGIHSQVLVEGIALIKYILCPGYVQSKFDGERHYIGWTKLAELYGVAMSECVINSEFRGALDKGLKRLYPRPDGDYKL